ncbi:hypothetical protein [Aquabacterium sp.]|uniref:hypothetical protein n=1 Tax=Aquabacterium sp. TaxID=1872578 RepID=UPI002CE9E845|nr:hypothetical protein [Aquabacterium sp.]HSW05694.1 hypothetical protein [Aquabacterium sp.]
MNLSILNRRSLLLLPAALATAPAFAQGTRTGTASTAANPHRMVQLVDAAADEAPTAARPAREAVLVEVQRRAPMDLGGFRLDFSNGRRGRGFVTHTLLRADGSLFG